MGQTNFKVCPKDKSLSQAKEVINLKIYKDGEYAKGKCLMEVDKHFRR